MDLEITGTTDRWLKLKKDGIGVDFLGIPILIANISFSKIKICLLILLFLHILASRLLVEYEIKMEVLQLRVVNNVSRAHLEFVFTRRMEYHVTNTFLQVRNLKTCSHNLTPLVAIP